MYTRTGEFTRFSTPTPRPFSGVMRFAPEGAIAVAIVMTFASAVWGGYNALSEHQRNYHPAAAVATGVIASVDRRLSHNKRYSAEVVVATPFVTGAAQTWTVHVARRTGQPLENARISADAWMPESREHSLTRPAVSDVGDGNYRIDNFSFSRPGWWNVALVIDGSAGTDSLAFNLILPLKPVISSETKP